MKAAFLGMGLMGAPMALNLIKAGHEVTVYNRTASRTLSLAAAGARVAASPAEATRGQQAVLLCVSDTPDVESVLLGGEGVIHGLPKEANPPVLVIDHSTISPDATARIAHAIESQTAALYLDAPVSGGDTGAKEGTLSMMCGGSPEAFALAQPLLMAMGKTLTHIGPRHGDGQRAKMVNQLLVALNCLATTEAMRMGEAMGLDMDRVLAAVSNGAAGSWSLSNLGPRWLRQDFAPGFRLRHLLKDVSFCTQSLGQAFGDTSAQYPGVFLVHSLLERAVAAEHGDENIHALGRIFDGRDSGKI
jgi:3-hydroxyisobutyrate dehydrogenase